MPNSPISILVVDDTKFSSALICRALNQAGYQDVRFANSASEALQLLEERPVGILLADWLMPEIDGLELTARVRQQDAQSDHYTYVMLLTGREGDSDLGEAFSRGVDDFISKTKIHEQLIPRVMAGERLCNTLQRLLLENHQLTQSVTRDQRSLVDPLTGLGNAAHLRNKLADCLRDLDSRGGAFCLLLIGVPQLPELRHRHGEAVHHELLTAIAGRLQQQVRPTDVLARPDDAYFALIALLDRLEESSVNSFRRLADRLNHQAFNTHDGTIQLHANIALLGVDNRALPQTPEQLLQQAAQLLAQNGPADTLRIRQLG